MNIYILIRTCLRILYSILHKEDMKVVFPFNISAESCLYLKVARSLVILRVERNTADCRIKS